MYQAWKPTPEQAEQARNSGLSVVDLTEKWEAPAKKVRKTRCKVERIYNPYESDIQARVVNELRDMLAPGYIVQANVQERSGFIAGGKAKAIGQEAGWPDLGVYGDGRCWLIEMKDKEGDKTDSQERMHPRIHRAGIPLLEICRDLATAVSFLRANGARFRKDAP